MPFYLHPRNPLPRDAKIYEGHPGCSARSGRSAQETAVHALRLMGSGLFDVHPRLQIILGHMGENLPFALWRIDNANGWIENRHNYAAEETHARIFLRQLPRHHVGQFPHAGAVRRHAEIGADRVMFSTDWPFENIDHAANWFDTCPISENDRLKIGRTNALRLFKLGNE